MKLKHDKCTTGKHDYQRRKLNKDYDNDQCIQCCCYFEQKCTDNECENGSSCIKVIKKRSIICGKYLQ